MNTVHIAVVCAACSILCACGGDDGTQAPPAGTTTYPEVVPTLGSVDAFVVANIDDSGNAIATAYEEHVTAVGGDGSYQLSQYDPGNQTLTVNGITYHYNPTVRDYGGSTTNDGQETGYTVTLASGGTVACTVAIQSGGHPRPWYVGQTWTVNYGVTCGSSTTAYVETGSVDAAESITLPAGTFNALKNSSSTTWTTATGENIVEHSTAWVDPAHSFFTLKRVIAYQRTGNLPTHYVTSQTIELQSRR